MSPYQAYEHDSLPLDTNSPFFWDHVARYWWASSFAKDKNVLDCACGRGYGSFILSHSAHRVLAIDLNPESLSFAAARFHRQNLEFRSQDVLELAKLDEKFDLITAFEVIEHIPSSETKEFLLALKDSLKPGGKLILSTPNHDVVFKSGMPVPEFHINNFPARELRAALQEVFPTVNLLGQFRERGPINFILFTMDRWNLRHQLRHLARKNVAKGALADSSSSGAGFEANFSEVIPFLTHFPEEAKRYRFSPTHWRQAGLTVAICEK